jgi:hypothetical protein
MALSLVRFVGLFEVVAVETAAAVDDCDDDYDENHLVQCDELTQGRHSEESFPSFRWYFLCSFLVVTSLLSQDSRYLLFRGCGEFLTPPSMPLERVLDSFSLAMMCLF